MVRIMAVVAACLLAAGAVAAQDDQPAAQPAEVSIYGEVRAVDAQAGTVAVQYYDYDTDEEKSINLAVGPNAKLENVANLGEVKKGDWVDATYAVIDGTNAAKTVSVEKDEEEEPAEELSETM